MSIDLALHRIKDLLQCFDHYTIPTIHVAGTNGKGSVSAFLSQTLLEAELSVGRFNSPHLLEVQDSITINNEAISKEHYEAVSDEVARINKEKSIDASNFEALTVTALVIFERSAVDVVVCEVGLGGRLDATNIIPDDAILVSVITSIDLDHQAFLGSTTSAIAREKAGIIRRRKPVVMSTQKHEDVYATVSEVAHANESELILAPVCVSRDWEENIDGPRPNPFSLSPFSPVPPRPVSVIIEGSCYKLLLPLDGDHQLVNLATAIAVLHRIRQETNNRTSVHETLSRLNTAQLHAGIRNTRWPGRLSFYTYGATSDDSRPLTVLADGAHNEAAAIMLASYVSELLGSLCIPKTDGNVRKISLTYILALSHSPPKTPESVLLPLLTLPLPKKSSLDVKTEVAFLRFSPPAGMPWVKSVHPSVMKGVAETVQSEDRNWDVQLFAEEPVHAQPDLKEALQWAAARRKHEDRESLVVVAGSLYLVADLLRLLKD